MTLLLGSTEGGDDYGRARFRGADGDTIFLTWTSHGKDRDGELHVTDGAYITVLDDYRVWTKTPRYREDGEVRKDGYDEYTAGNPTRPVPRIQVTYAGRAAAYMGMGFADFVSTVDSKLTLILNGGNSYVTAVGASMSSYLWDVDDGTITVGTSSSSQITVTFPAGRRWITLRIQDSNGQTVTRKAFIVAAERTGSNAPLQSFQITNAVKTMRGWDFGVRIQDAIAEGTYPDGVAAIYWEEEYYAGSIENLLGSIGHIKFSGWHQSHDESVDVTAQGIRSGVDLSFGDVGAWLDRLPGFPQVIERKDPSNAWFRMADANIDRYIHYLLHWHCTALELTDFYWSGTGDTYGFNILSSGGQSLWEQATERAGAIGYFLTCDWYGRLRMVPDPQLQDTGDRTSIVIVDLDETDWRYIRYSKHHPPRSHWLRSSAVVADTTDLEDVEVVQAVFCLAPGLAPGIGLVETQQGEMLVADQDELNTREGHRYASKLNQKYGRWEIGLAHGNDAGIDPALAEWVRLNMSASNSGPRGLVLSDERFLPVEVHVTYDHEANTKTTTLYGEREVTSGVEAVTYEPPSAGDNPYRPPVDPPDPPPDWDDPDDPWFPPGISTLAMISTDGYLYITTDFNTKSASGGPTWTRYNLSLTGTPLQFVVDGFSYGTGQIDGWIITTERIYKIDDIFGTRTTTSQFTFRDTVDGGLSGVRSVDASFAEDGFVVVASYYANAGTYVTYTTDGGSTWATEVLITSHRETGGGAAHSPGLYVSSKTPGKVIVTAFITTGSRSAAEADAFYSTDYGATWTQITSPPTGGPDIRPLDGLNWMHLPWHDNANERIAYFTENDMTGVSGGIFTLFRVESDGTTRTDIAPVVSGWIYGGRWPRWTIDTCAINRQRVLLCGYSSDSPATGLYYAVFVSDDGGDTWTTIWGPQSTRVNAYLRGAVSGSNEDVFYMFGSNGMIGYVSDGATIDDRRGNITSMSSPSPGDMVGICGA
jgi:hypothetical protein